MSRRNWPTDWLQENKKVEKKHWQKLTIICSARGRTGGVIILTKRMKLRTSKEQAPKSTDISTHQLVKFSQKFVDATTICRQAILSSIPFNENKWAALTLRLLNYPAKDLRKPTSKEQGSNNKVWQVICPLRSTALCEPLSASSTSSLSRPHIPCWKKLSGVSCWHW